MLVYNDPMTTLYSKFTSYTKVALDIIYNCVDIIYSRVAKNRRARERGSHEVKTSRTNCDPGYKKHKGENIYSETNIQNVHNENIYRCVTYIYIYVVVRQKVL